MINPHRETTGPLRTGPATRTQRLGPMGRSSRPLPTVMALVMTGVALAACGGAPESTVGIDATVGAPLVDVAPVTPMAPTGPAVPAQSDGGADRPVVASQSFRTEGVELLAELNPVTVKGQVMVVNVTISSADSNSDRWLMSRAFGDAVDDAGSIPLSVAELSGVDGITVIDTVNATRHLVARDDRGLCVCSTTDGVFLEPGDKLVLSAVFAAAPEGVDTVDVFVPLVGTFEAVPVQR